MEKPEVKKFSISFPPKLFQDFEDAWKRRGYGSRSEAIREAIRRWMRGE